jgi:hypothetical protein
MRARDLLCDVDSDLFMKRVQEDWTLMCPTNVLDCMMYGDELKTVYEKRKR